MNTPEFVNPQEATSSGEVLHPESYATVPVTRQDGGIGQVYAADTDAFQAAGSGHVSTPTEIAQQRFTQDQDAQQLLGDKQQEEILENTFAGMGVPYGARGLAVRGLMLGNGLSLGSVPAISQGLYNATHKDHTGDEVGGLFKSIRHGYPASSLLGELGGNAISAGITGGFGGAQAASRLGLTGISGTAAAAAVDNVIMGQVAAASSDYSNNIPLSIEKMAYTGGVDALIGAGAGAGIHAAAAAIGHAAPHIGAWAEAHGESKAITEAVDFNKAASELGLHVNASTPEEIVKAAKNIRSSASEGIAKAVKLDGSEAIEGLGKSSLVDEAVRQAHEANLDGEKVRKVLDHLLKGDIQKGPKVEPPSGEVFTPEPYTPGPKFDGRKPFVEKSFNDTVPAGNKRIVEHEAKKAAHEASEARRLHLHNESEIERFVQHGQAEVDNSMAHHAIQADLSEQHAATQEAQRIAYDRYVNGKESDLKIKDLISAKSRIDVKGLGPEGAFAKNYIVNAVGENAAKGLESKGLSDAALSLRNDINHYNWSDAAFDAANKIPKEKWKTNVKDTRDPAFKFSPSPWAIIRLAGKGLAGGGIGHMLGGVPGAVLGAAVPAIGGAAKRMAYKAIAAAVPSVEAGVAIKNAILKADGTLTSQAQKVVTSMAAPTSRAFSAVGPKFTRTELNQKVLKYRDILSSQGHPNTKALGMIDPRLEEAANTQLATVAKNILNVVGKSSPGFGQESSVAGKRIQPKGLSPEEMAAMRYIAAAENPSVVLKLAKLNSLSKDHMMALKDNYPQLMEQIQKEITQLLTQRAGTKAGEKAMPVSRRAQLSSIIGQPLDYTTSPSYVSEIQKGFAPAQPAPKPSGGGGNPTDTSELTTPSEKIEQ